MRNLVENDFFERNEYQNKLRIENKIELYNKYLFLLYTEIRLETKSEIKSIIKDKNNNIKEEVIKSIKNICNSQVLPNLINLYDDKRLLEILKNFLLKRTCIYDIINNFNKKYNIHNINFDIMNKFVEYIIFNGECYDNDYIYNFYRNLLINIL